MEIIQSLNKAGISVAEFAKLCGVTRISVYNWDNGKAIHPLRAPKITKLLSAVIASTDAGDFPPKTSVRKQFAAQRDREIKSVIVKYLKQSSTPT